MLRLGNRRPIRPALRVAALILVVGAAVGIGMAGYREFQIRSAERALAQGRLREAASILAPLAQGGVARAVVPLARVWLRQGRVRSIIGLLAPRMPNATDPAELAILGEACLAIGDEGQALTAYQAFVTAQPDDVPGLSRLAMLTYRQVGPAPSLDLYSRLEDLQPSNPAWPATRGQIAVEIDRFELAVEAFRKALRLAPDQVEIRFAMAESEFLVGDLHACLADLDACLAAQPTEMPYALARAECLHALGRMDEAARSLEMILGRTPDDPKALRLRAELHLERGMQDRAVPLLEHAREMAPEDWRVRYQLARAYEATGRNAEAREQIAVMQEQQQAVHRHD